MPRSDIVNRLVAATPAEGSTRPNHRGRRVAANLPSPLRTIVLAVALAAGAAPAAAIGLGSAEVTSYLGQPLQMRVPLSFDDLADGSTQCPRIVPQASPDVPTLAMGRVDIERSVTQSYVRITTPLPVDEPVLRVVLEVGCLQRVRREYTVLLDPPAPVAVLPAAPVAPRFEFGVLDVIGTRGQPLIMNVPIRGEGVPSLTPACVRAGQGDGNEPRTLADARVTLVDKGAGQRALRIQTADVVNDARVRVAVELGCDQPVRQEFTVLVDAPRLASTPAPGAPQAEEAPAPVAAKPAVKPAAKPAGVAKPVQPAPVAPAASVAPNAAAKAKSSTSTAEPTRVPAAEQPAAPRTDRLVLSAPEDAPKAVAPSGDDGPRPVREPAASGEDREQVLKRLEVLAAEVKTLRAELDASAQRNRELSEKARSSSYAWAIAAGSALLLGVAMLIGWRHRPQSRSQQADHEPAGPMTRILGTQSERSARAQTQAAHAAPATANAGMTDGAGPSTVAAILAAHRSAHGHDFGNEDPTAMVVTEIRVTSQGINDLYLPHGDRLPPRPAPAPADAGSLDLGGERTTVLAPPTKTEIAVDIDLSATDTQITRDLQREYERVAEVFAEKPRPTESVRPAGTANESELPTRFDTVPATGRLALDLDLDLTTVVRPDTPKRS